MPSTGCSMRVSNRRYSLPGHEGYGTIEIVYDFKPGVQVRYTNSSLSLSLPLFGCTKKFLALCKCGDWNKITLPPNLSIITTYFSLSLSIEWSALQS